jgi:hypothetical protein
VTVDSTGNPFVTLRAKYEFSTREGSHFEAHLLEEVGEQPDTRHFDIANRDRSRFTGTINVTPVAFFGVNASLFTGKDDYKDTGFGLRDSTSRGYSFGVDLAPADTVTFGTSYGYEKYTALSYSRTSNPLPNPFFTDPTRDWWTDQNDTVKTFTADLDLIKTIPKTDLRFGFDVSDGKALYLYGIPVNATIPAPVQLTPLKNKLTGARADVQYFVRSNVAFGVAYWYEEYTVDDFSQNETLLNTLAPANATTGVIANTIYSGYLQRNYKAHTGWVRVTYLW